MRPETEVHFMIYEEKEKTTQKPHNVILENRSQLTVTGVEDVDTFDDNRIILKTVAGTLLIRGENLHIDKLSVDTGDMSVTGKVTDMGYEDTAPAGSLWSRLFK